LDKATALIKDTREHLADNMGELLTKNFNRANRAMVTMQVLAELEEVIQFRREEQRISAIYSAEFKGRPEFGMELSIGSPVGLMGASALAADALSLSPALGPDVDAYGEYAGLYLDTPGLSSSSSSSNSSSSNSNSNSSSSSSSSSGVVVVGGHASPSWHVRALESRKKALLGKWKKRLLCAPREVRWVHFPIPPCHVCEAVEPLCFHLPFSLHVCQTS
jgi:hypothetical protein